MVEREFGHSDKLKFVGLPTDLEKVKPYDFQDG